MMRRKKVVSRWSRVTSVTGRRRVTFQFTSELSARYGGLTCSPRSRNVPTADKRVAAIGVPRSTRRARTYQRKKRSRSSFRALLGFLWGVIAGVTGCGLRRGSEVRRATNLRRDPHESRMEHILLLRRLGFAARPTLNPDGPLRVSTRRGSEPRSHNRSCDSSARRTPSLSLS